MRHKMVQSSIHDASSVSAAVMKKNTSGWKLSISEEIKSVTLAILKLFLLGGKHK